MIKSAELQRPFTHSATGAAFRRLCVQKLSSIYVTDWQPSGEKAVRSGLRTSLIPVGFEDRILVQIVLVPSPHFS